MATPVRYFLKNLVVNTTLVKANADPNFTLHESIKEVAVNFNSFTSSLEILPSSHTESGNFMYKNVKLVRDITVHPGEKNETIALACLVFINNEHWSNINDFGIGPLIVRSKKLRSFPGKLSPAGGLYDTDDLTCERTAFREVMEEFRLHEYLSPLIIGQIQLNMKVTHLIFSHPLVNGSRRFNVTLVFNVTLHEASINQFDSKMFQVDEVDQVINCLKGKELLESIINHSPFDENVGWTPNGVMVVLDYLKIVAKNHINSNLLCNGILRHALENFLSSELHSPQKEELQKFIMMYLAPLLYALTTTYTSEVIVPVNHRIVREGILPLNPCIVHVPEPMENDSTASGQLNIFPTASIGLEVMPKHRESIRKAYEEVIVSIKTKPELKLTGALKGLWDHRHDAYDIDRFLPSTSTEEVANDIAYTVRNSNNFVVSFSFNGYDDSSNANTDKNYAYRLKKFEAVISLLSGYDIRVSRVALMTGGNEYYGEGPSQTGVRLECKTF